MLSFAIFAPQGAELTNSSLGIRPSYFYKSLFANPRTVGEPCEQKLPAGRSDILHSKAVFLPTAWAADVIYT
jgi:hypothetical protein